MCSVVAFRIVCFEWKKDSTMCAEIFRFFLIFVVIIEVVVAEFFCDFLPLFLVYRLLLLIISKGLCVLHASSLRFLLFIFLFLFLSPVYLAVEMLWLIVFFVWVIIITIIVTSHCRCSLLKQLLNLPFSTSLYFSSLFLFGVCCSFFTPFIYFYLNSILIAPTVSFTIRFALQ